MKQFILNGFYSGIVFAFVITVLVLVKNYTIGFVFLSFWLPLLGIFSFLGISFGLISHFFLSISQEIFKSRSLSVFVLFNLFLMLIIYLGFMVFAGESLYSDYLGHLLFLAAMLYLIISNYFIAKKIINQRDELIKQNDKT
jgi:hypothetical protein